MAKIRAAPKEGSTRVLVFDASLKVRAQSGRSMSGLVGIFYDGDIENFTTPGKYKAVSQTLRGGRWVHVSNAELEIT